MWKDKDFLGGLIFFVIGMVSFLGIHELPYGDLHTPGPGFFPFYLSIILAILSVMLFYKSSRKVRLSKGTQTPESEGRRIQVLLAVAGLTAYIILLPRLGYVLCSLLIMILFMRVVEKNTWRTTLVITLCSTAVSYIVFAKYLGIPLPMGIIPF